MQAYPQLLRRFSFILLFVAAISGCSAIPEPTPEGTSFTMTTGRYGHATVTDGKSLFVLGGSTDKGLSGDIEIINPQSSTSELLKDKIIPRRYFSAVWDGEESIYIIGGISAHEGRPYLQTAVEVFNVRTHEVKLTQAHDRATRGNTAVLADNKIYVFGGETAGKKLRNALLYVPWVSVFDTNTQTWAALPDMPVALSTRAAAYNGDIYITGGFDGRRQYRDFYKFDLSSMNWSAMPDMPVATSAHSVVATKDGLYTFGDYDQLDQVLYFDFARATWLNAALPFKPSRHNASAAIVDKIFVTGGNVRSRDSHLNAVQVFTPQR
ncbi:Kelch repeat-containing protein [Alteromonas gilva]|uniref:Kelch repeat-containing protein n=1 Tax=Alteromonas gilva TaxID=2987522 RepID=A0ABT5L0M3_9ALTE|nr:kelch repeat-containing protein [Alteromonas gilva]MDC8830575.1 kelch repeat-containing protein [Alteromonas gilva]